jgi:hypothetical protein
VIASGSIMLHTLLQPCKRIHQTINQHPVRWPHNLAWLNDSNPPGNETRLAENYDKLIYDIGIVRYG